MKLSIITVFPQFYDHFLGTSLIARAIQEKRLSVQVLQFSQFVEVKQRIDEPTVGPGAGMIIKPEVMEAAIEHAKKTFGEGKVIFFSPQGTVLNQRVVKKLVSEFSVVPVESENVGSTQDELHLILVCPRYEGIDPRVEKHYADTVISIGDYVLMGGDLPAQVFLEALLRYLPGVVGDQRSVENDSFSTSLLDYPEYGLPSEWKGMAIPDILRSGNHALINEWRHEKALEKTILKRFDWFASSQPEKNEREAALKKIPPHYVVLMHDQIKQADGRIGTTSVTSIDLHDTARSCATYGIKNFFVVTPLEDQQRVIDVFLSFWRSEEGKEYNLSRYKAVSRVLALKSLEEAIQTVRDQTGQEPLIIATCAKKHSHTTKIDYKSQTTVWAHNRPVLFLFGTGQGLADAVVEKADYLLVPVNGLTDFNHLSVRSAMAIILDRWLGLQPQIIQDIVKTEK